MSSRDQEGQQIGAPLTYGHPFRQYLRPLSHSLIPSVAHVAPLPLAAMLAQPHQPKTLFFAYSCSTVEAHVLSLTGPETKASLIHPQWISLLYVASGEVNLLQVGKEIGRAHV